jgi:hypothetical protein
MFSKMRRVVVLSLFVVLLLSGTVVSVIQTTPAPQAPQTTQTLQAIPQTPEASGGNNTANISFSGNGIPNGILWMLETQDVAFNFSNNWFYWNTLSPGSYKYVLEAPPGYSIWNISVSVLVRTALFLTIPVNQRTYILTFNISNTTHEISFPTIPVGAYVHFTVYFVHTPNRVIWYPWILVLIGIVGGTLGIMDGNRRRRIKKGYKENEERKKMEGIMENKTGTWKREVRPRPRKETRKETRKEPTKETKRETSKEIEGEPILDEDILRGQNQAPPETLPPANPEKKEEEEDDEEEDMEREETDEFSRYIQEGK